MGTGVGAAFVDKHLVFQRAVPAEQPALVNNITHWGYGMLGGAQYGIVAGSLASPRIVYGIPFGATVWTGRYIVLPVMHLYKPSWGYDAKTLSQDLSTHFVSGLKTATAFDVLSRG